MKYSISKDQKSYYASVLLLENMINFGDKFKILLDGDDKLLEDTFAYMMSKKWLDINSDSYIPTEKGREVLTNYKERLVEFRSLYKYFSAVDTGEGEFGYSSYFDFDTDGEFKAHIDDERFEDLRVAVCEFKKINPLDIIFMEMVSGGEFDTAEENWQFNLISGLIWDDIEEIANTNLSVEDLTEYDDDDEITSTGEEIVEIILKQGTDLCKELAKEQARLDEEENDNEEEDENEYEEEETVVEETIEYIEDPYYELDYWDSYYDPYYVSPCWGCCYY